jgi:two-component system LytT family sensor kinase
MQLLSKKDIVRHLIVWGIISICASIADPMLGGWKVCIIGPFLIMGSYMFTYYFLNLFIFQKFLQGKYLQLIIWIIIAYIIFETWTIFNDNFALPSLGGQNIRYPIPVLLVNTLLLFFLLFMGALGNHMNRVGTQKIKIQNEREREFIVKELDVLKKEKAVISKELDFLKNQFNAHITFNFLSFCYSKVHKTSETAATAIITFSDMLRYSLHIKPDENVSLRKEIEYLKNFINIQRCLTAEIHANFKYEGCVDAKFILPRILITFVENAFKHGQINNRAHPIDIHLFATPERVVFKVRNKKNKEKKIISSDIGHQNVKQMLDSFYKEHYTLKIEDLDTDYYSELILII